MTRWDLITSDEYTKTIIENIVVSGKSIKEIRMELEDMFLKLKNELIGKL